MQLFLLLLTGIFPIISIASTFPAGTQYSVCFTPQQNCTHKIVKQINAAKKYINAQAYSFTSKPIVKALIAAHNRGVDVKVILDKSNFQPDTYSLANSLIKHDVALWDDSKLNIAHNKVMIFDGDTVETGSFNYTTSAQYYNAENVLIIHDKALADRYLANWFARKKVSSRIH